MFGFVSEADRVKIRGMNTVRLFKFWASLLAIFGDDGDGRNAPAPLSGQASRSPTP